MTVRRRPSSQNVRGRGIRRRLAGVGAGLLLSVLVLVVGIGILEAAGRSLFPGALAVIRDVDHRMRPDGHGINSDGIRCRVEAGTFPPEDLNVILLGDSFVFGMDLDAEDTLSAQLQAIARAHRAGIRVNVINFGWISASPLLSLRQLREIGPRYHPDVVVECFDMTDFHNDLMYERLLEPSGIYRLLDVVPVTILSIRSVLTHVPLLDPLHRRLFGYPGRKFFASAQPLDESRPYLSSSRRNLDAIADQCRGLGARFVLAILPRSYQYSDRESPRSWEASQYVPLGPHALEPFRYFEGMATEVPYPVVSLLRDFQETDVFPTCFEDDPHWNPDGTRVAAEALYRALAREGCFSSAPTTASSGGDATASGPAIAPPDVGSLSRSRSSGGIPPPRP